jgi:hypothetical protein
MDDDDFDLLDDWSETEAGDSSDTWDDFDESFGYGAAEDLDDEDDDLFGDEAEEEDLFGEADAEWSVEADGGVRGGGGGAVEDRGARGEGGRAVGMSAWEFGTATAVAGWLLDRQADRIAEAITREQARPAAGTPAAPGAAAAAAWRRLTGPALDPAAAPLAPGEGLERSRLAATIDERLTQQQPLGFEARVQPGRRPADPALDPMELLFTVVVQQVTPEAPVWVMFEERVGGFSTARLLPVFDGTGPPGRAYCFVDSGTAATHVIEWGLERYGLALSDFQWTSGF